MNDGESILDLLPHRLKEENFCESRTEESHRKRTLYDWIYVWFSGFESDFESLESRATVMANECAGTDQEYLLDIQLTSGQSFGIWKELVLPD